MTSPTRVPCAACSGSGSRDLTQLEIATLGALRADLWRTGAEIRVQLSARDNCAPTALCNRLVKLQALGLVTRRQRGREAEWLLVTKPRSRIKSTPIHRQDTTP